jgi:class 3 adenylate cyclase
MLAMTEQEKIVVLQVDVRESTRTRLRIQAVKMGVTMGELDEALKKLEKQG